MTGYLALLLLFLFGAGCTPDSNTSISGGDTDTFTDTNSIESTDECAESTQLCGTDEDSEEFDTNLDFCGVSPCELFAQEDGYIFNHEGAPYEGTLTPTNQIVITTFANFDCPGCKDLANELKTIFSDSSYADNAIHYFHHFIFESDSNSEKWNPHKAAHAAHLQGHFWEVHDLFFNTDLSLEGTDIHKAVEQLELLDMNRYYSDIDAPSTVDHIQGDILEFKEGADGNSVPVVYVNGHKVRPWMLVQNVLDYLLGYSRIGESPHSKLLNNFWNHCNHELIPNKTRKKEIINETKICVC